jgi:type II secretory ATPase GspE/PulE/Tfp pilus assembly ATPase PilB-like protein
VVRLLDMGMDPFNFADALLGVLSQRLVKRLCTHCRQPYHPDESELERMVNEYCEDLSHTPFFQLDPDKFRVALRERWAQTFADAAGQFTLYAAKGCEHCTEGYKGRLGIHELMQGSARIKELIQDRVRVSRLQAVALEEGMQTLRQDGIEKVLAGLTDLRQVRKACAH